jgi:DNA-binding FrmR family transcriptional regulator
MSGFRRRPFVASASSKARCSTGCVEILTQISAIHEALRGVGKLIVRHHIETCVTEGLQTDKKQQHQDELMDLIYKLSK